MANPASLALQVGNANMGTASRLPQTSAKPTAGAPFPRLSRKARNRGYVVTFTGAGGGFAQLVTQPLKPVGGWLRQIVLTIIASGGTGTAAVAAADAPWNVIQTLMFRDPLGQPIINVDGYGLYEIQKYSGQLGQAKMMDPSQLPSYSAIATSGNFTIKLQLPLELDSSGYCSLNSMNAAATAQLDIQFAASTTVYSTPPTGVPQLQVTAEQNFWAAPIQNPAIGPPDAGATAQWTKTGGQTSVASATNVLVASPRTGTYIHTLITILRDANGVRQDNYPLTDLTFQVDGVPVFLERFDDRVDDMARWTDGISRDTGVVVWSFRDAVQPLISVADTHDLLLQTTPATLLEVGGTFQTITAAPGSLTFYTGELWPTNAARIPWSHLAQ